jgi:transcriptional regulator with XRE-family HTH domain
MALAKDLYVLFERTANETYKSWCAWLARSHSSGGMRAYKIAVRRRLAERVIAARKRQGLSHERLAELAGISPKEVSRVENAGVNVSIDIVSAIAKALSVDVSHFFSPLGDKDKLSAAFPILVPEDLDTFVATLAQFARLGKSLQRRRKIRPAK